MGPHPSDSGLSVTLPSRVLPLPASRPQHTTAAMEQFHCIAERCEDTCCRDWAVPITRDDLDAMRATMSTTPEGRERLIRLVVIGNRSRVADGRAQLQMDDDCACPMLEKDNRCGVHAAFGEKALTTPCSIFPRTALALHDRVEVGGSLGCPEVARLMLLSEESLRLRPATAAMLPRAYVGKTVDDDPTGAYSYYFLGVRAALGGCFRAPLPIGVRFVLAADLAARLEPFFHAGTSEFQGARRTFAEHRLQSEINDTESTELRASLASDLAGLDIDGNPVATFVRSFLRDRQRLPHSPRFASLLDEVFHSLEGEAMAAPPPVAPGPSSSGAPATPVSPDLAAATLRRRVALDARTESRLDAILGRYCQHFLMRNPYTDAPALTEYIFNLGVQLAAVRLLIVGHPEVAARLAAVPDAREDRAVLERVSVHVIQTYTKAISHHPEYLEAAIPRSAAPGGRITFGRLVLLAKFM